MSENKRFKPIPETGSYKDIVTGEILSPQFEEDFYKVLDLLNENDELKKTNDLLSDFRGYIDIKQQGIKDEKQQKRFLKIHDDYYIQYGDDKELFDLHKPADIRSLCIILNREHGFSELQCEYNDKEYGE